VHRAAAAGRDAAAVLDVAALAELAIPKAPAMAAATAAALIPILVSRFIEVLLHLSGPDHPRLEPAAINQT